jgi:subtilisin-like proprotein convertase family protein/subtilisin family serine protease
MPQDQTYTYRAGQKVLLEKKPDQFVVRASPERLREVGIEGAERMTAGSSRVTTRALDLEPMMSRARHTAPTHHAYTVAETGEDFLITDRVFVTFRSPLRSDEVDAFAGKYGLVSKEKYSDRDYLFQLTDHTGMNPVKLVVKLIEDEALVESADHDLNHRVRTYQFSVPADPSYVRQWHLHTRLNDPDVDRRSSAHCEDAWQLLDGFGSADVVIGVTDDGCRLDHMDFNSPGKFAGWGYFQGERLITHTDIDADPARMYQAGANHGTSCAGVIGGEVDAVLTVGAAPGCRLLPIKWESSGPFLDISDSTMLTVLNYVADKVDVLSNSWGGVPTSVWAQPVVSRITTLAQSGGRRGRGIVFLWAAGNENCPIQHTALPSVQVPYDSGWSDTGTWVGVRRTNIFRNNLVGIPGVMHVAALASTAQRSHYSNYGTGIALCAPTNNGHKYRRLTVRGLGVTTTTGSSSGVTSSFGGTSSATPLVAGIAGLVISANPDLTALNVISILKQTAAKDLDGTGYPHTPPANFNADTSWDISPIAPFAQGAFTNIGAAEGTWSPWFGHGRVDAAGAVAEALRSRPTQPGATIQKTSTPGVQIPDNDPVGLRDSIQITETARVGSVKVRVDITHPYIGDLQVSLIAPSGVTVVLHNRNGGRTANINGIFDAATTPILTALRGQLVQGSWGLHVQDLAGADIGTLQRWGLEIVGQTGTVVEQTDAPGANIPDANAVGIERALTVTESGRVRDLEVAIDITHTYIGDLVVTLVAPSGTSIPLHQQSGGRAENIIRTYSMTNTSALQVLRGQTVQGPWKLKVADLVADDVGKLNRWTLHIVQDA